MGVLVLENGLYGMMVVGIATAGVWRGLLLPKPFVNTGQPNGVLRETHPPSAGGKSK